MSEKRFVRFMKIHGEYITNYGGFELKESTHSKGAGKAQRTSWFYVETHENAWNEYMRWLGRISPQNYCLATLHWGYLDLRKQAQHGELSESEWVEYKEFCKQQANICGVPMRYIRHYLKTNYSEICDSNSRRLDMQVIPFDFEW